MYKGITTGCSIIQYLCWIFERNKYLHLLDEILKKQCMKEFPQCKTFHKMSINELRSEYNWGRHGKPKIVSLCYGKDGIIRTTKEEANRKISKAKQGKHYPKLSEAAKNRRCSSETRQKISDAHKGKKLSFKTCKKMSEARKGKSNPQWLGGISNLPYAFNFDIELKDLIKRRDKYTCQLCQKRKRKKNLCVHHIDYDKQNSNSKNLITLCKSCNSKANYGRKHWTKFFVQKLKLIS